jgi:hypothetical protein
MEISPLRERREDIHLLVEPGRRVGVAARGEKSITHSLTHLPTQSCSLLALSFTARVDLRVQAPLSTYLIPESGVKTWISGLKWFEFADAAEYVADQIP